jgi:acyl-coenzyme A thioesterase PaaI-like protein
MGVLSIEFKVNMLAPARGSHFLAQGRVLRAGRTITVCAGDVVAVQDGAEVAVATMLATMMTVAGRAGVED